MHKESEGESDLNTLLCNQIAEQLFNQSCVYHCGLKELGLGWSHEHTQYRVELSNCRFHAKQVLKALDSLGYELKQKDLSA